MQTTLSLSDDQAFQLANQIIGQYCRDPRSDSKTLGEWVLQTFYPNVFAEDIPNGRDFYFAQRTSDARLYLVGLLRSNSLDTQQVVQALAECTTTC